MEHTTSDTPIRPNTAETSPTPPSTPETVSGNSHLRPTKSALPLTSYQDSLVLPIQEPHSSSWATPSILHTMPRYLVPCIPALMGDTYSLAVSLSLPCHSKSAQLTMRQSRVLWWISQSRLEILVMARFKVWVVVIRAFMEMFSSMLTTVFLTRVDLHLVSLLSLLLKKAWMIWWDGSRDLSMKLWKWMTWWMEQRSDLDLISAGWRFCKLGSRCRRIRLLFFIIIQTLFNIASVLLVVFVMLCVWNLFPGMMCCNWRRNEEGGEWRSKFPSSYVKS